MNTIKKLIYWIICLTSCMSFVLVALCQKLPNETMAMITSLNKAFDLSISTNPGQIQVICFVIVGISIPLFILAFGLKSMKAELLEAQNGAHTARNRAILEELKIFLNKQNALKLDLLSEGLRLPANLLETLLLSVASQDTNITDLEKRSGDASETVRQALLGINQNLDSHTARLQSLSKVHANLNTQLNETGERKAELDEQMGQFDPEGFDTRIADLENDSNAIAGRLTKIEGFKLRIEALLSKLAELKQSSAPYFHEEAGVDVMLNKAKELLEKIDVQIDDNIDSDDDLSDFESEVSEVEDDSNNLKDRIDILIELAERLKTAGSELKKLIGVYQNLLDGFKVEEKTAG